MSNPLERHQRPSNSADALETETQFTVHDRSPGAAPHFLEFEVQRQLLSEPRYQFTSLVVRRTKSGVCLDGVLIADEEAPNVTELVRKTCSVEDVVNRLVVCRSGAGEMVS